MFNNSCFRPNVEIGVHSRLYFSSPLSFQATQLGILPSLLSPFSDRADIKQFKKRQVHMKKVWRWQESNQGPLSKSRLWQPAWTYMKEILFMNKTVLLSTMSQKSERRIRQTRNSNIRLSSWSLCWQSSAANAPLGAAPSGIWWQLKFEPESAFRQN